MHVCHLRHHHRIQVLNRTCMWIPLIVMQSRPRRGRQPSEEWLWNWSRQKTAPASRPWWWCDVMWCDVMWCDVMWCDVMSYDVMWCDGMFDDRARMSSCNWRESSSFWWMDLDKEVVSSIVWYSLTNNIRNNMIHECKPVQTWWSSPWCHCRWSTSACHPIVA